jgi:hypothetical protein
LFGIFGVGFDRSGREVFTFFINGNSLKSSNLSITAGSCPRKIKLVEGLPLVPKSGLTRI